MKRIVTIILSVILSITISAQDRTPMDKIWEDIEKIISNRQDSKMKVNHGDGVLSYVHNGMVGEEYLCTKDCGGDTSCSFSSEEIEAANERNRKEVFGRIFGTIRHHLDSLTAISEESYHFESHSHGTDTITYSLCLKNSEDTIRKYKAFDGSMAYPDAIETVFFDYKASRKPCGKHVRGYGILGYNKNIYLPDRKSYYFNKEPYLEKILLLLKRKDVQSWSFKWAQSVDHNIQDSNEFERLEIIDATGPKDTGQTIGTMYFIPREKSELAEALFTAIDSVTLNYTDLHPEQIFRYSYNIKEWVMQYAESSNITQLFDGYTGPGHLTCVLFGITPKGYYVAIADVENKFCLPKEWSVVKSFVDGKKTYLKGLKPKEKQ